MGFLYCSEQNIIITQKEKIYFYTIDESLLPKLKNVSFNYLGDLSTLISKNMIFCVSFRLNTKNFTIITKKYNQAFNVKLSNEQFEGVRSLDLPKSNLFLISNINKLKIYNQETFQFIDVMLVELFTSETREPT